MDYIRVTKAYFFKESKYKMEHEDRYIDQDIHQDWMPADPVSYNQIIKQRKS